MTTFTFTLFTRYVYYLNSVLGAGFAGLFLPNLHSVVLSAGCWTVCYDIKSVCQELYLCHLEVDTHSHLFNDDQCTHIKRADVALGWEQANINSSEGTALIFSNLWK